MTTHSGLPSGLLPLRPETLRLTSAMPSGWRDWLPSKMTSSMDAPRRLLALCSPSTQEIASEMLLLPQPLGPTMPGHAALEGQLLLVAEGLEADDLDLLETHRDNP